MVNVGVLPAIQQAMQQHWNIASIQQFACAALYNIAAQNYGT